MILDLTNVPFTRRNSYMVISYITDQFRLFGRKIAEDEGLYLRSVRGDCRMNPLIAHLVPTYQGKAADYTYYSDGTEIVVELKAADAKIEIVFAEENTLLIRGQGEGIGLEFDRLAGSESLYDYVITIPYKEREFYEANLFRNASKYIFGSRKGKKSFAQDWQEQTAKACKIIYEAVDGEFEATVEEAQVEWKFREYTFSFDEKLAEVKKEFAEFCNTMPEVLDEYEEEKKLASYIDWCSQVKRGGRLTRDALYPSKNWMIGAFSWDHCFIAQALSYHRPKEAWDQFMIMFDYQDETGRIPDAVTDAYITWNFCKPPVHGWTLMKMMEHMELSKEQLQEAYERLAKWTHWWYDYRDSNHNGLCEYYHGNDCGWDNSTVFNHSITVESPDLSAELILQCEALGRISGMLGMEEADDWKTMAHAQMEKLLKYQFEGNKPVARDRNTGEIISCNSLLPYTCIILGKRLPEEKAAYIVNALKNEFLAPGGIATEKVDSELYQSDGYWRGPIWAPTTMMVLDGLWQLGEHEFVREVAKRFAGMVQKSGFPENFDSVTGAGNRDRAFSWTASTFMVIMSRYFMEN